MSTNQERISFDDVQVHIVNAGKALADFGREQVRLATESEGLLDRCAGCDGPERDWAEELAETINNFADLHVSMGGDWRALEDLAAKVDDGTLPEEPVAGIVLELACALEDLAFRSAGLLRGLLGLTRELADHCESSREADDE
jgi:hypothetical protein